ncbi:hypothetical protein KUCAC02_025120 [Chaenocephalus aceratus]|nr:hypothetical protein KUCAC02_025120 [Chaenocephalus aceratus]
MAANRKAKPGAALRDCDVSPHREANTSCVVSVKVPRERRALFLAVETDILHDKLSDELSFGALSPNERAMFQFLLYLTYCCKGELLQVTLENPDFYSMSPPIREDFAHGRLFCFILDVSKDTSCETNNESSGAPGDTEDYLSGSQMRSFMDEASVNMSVFRREGREDRGPSTASPWDKAGVEETLDEAFDAFMRLQLVRKKAVSLNNAMIYMRDSQGELSSKFDWVDIHSDTLNADKLDRKQVKELQGSMYLPSCQSGRQVVVLPEPITDLNLKALDEAIGRITDSVSKGEGKRLFRALLSKLTGTQWLKQRVVHKGYKAGMPIDVGFVERLKGFTGDLSRSPGSSEVDIRGLLVFRYSLEKLIDRESPDLFVRSLIHRHVPVTKARIHTVLVDIKSKRRTQELAGLLHRGRCHLMMQKFRENDSLYQGLSEVMDEQMNNSSFSLGHDLAEIHETLYLAPEKDRCASEGIGVLNPLKVYDRALVRYLFCDCLQVGRLFQASTTFNYIIANTAPRYTIERIMLFNITGPGEGKSYANNVLIYQFRRVRGCIESLTSFTPQAFKYKQKRTACVVIIDDGAISHEKTIRASDGESNVIPNTFKNLLDTSVLESDVVTRDASSGKVDTIKYQSVHNCGFVWNTNTMGFVTDAWADRSLVMDSEFPERMSRTRSTKQIQDTVDRDKMAHIAAVCLYRQNLIQSATMIAESGLMQFGERFDAARDACVAALHASHIVCTGVLSRRVPQCIN